jgi:hypothetical protein
MKLLAAVEVMRMEGTVYPPAIVVGFCGIHMWVGVAFRCRFRSVGLLLLLLLLEEEVVYLQTLGQGWVGSDAFDVDVLDDRWFFEGTSVGGQEVLEEKRGQETTTKEIFMNERDGRLR